MDFRSRGLQSTTPAGNSPVGGMTPSNKKKMVTNLMERSSVILLFAIAILILAIAGLTFFSGNAEGHIVKKDKYQAVFLNNGQVYFGHIHSLNSDFVDLQSIYYLQTNGGSTTDQTSSSSNNVSLVKLGCELHAPYDQMVINRDQVLFWENLQDSGQVVKAIAQYQKDNPNGQTCKSSSQSSTNQASPNTTTQNGTNPTSTSTTPTSTPKP